MTLMIPQRRGLLKDKQRVLTTTFLDSAHDVTDTTDYSFTMSFGAADNPHRRLAIFVNAISGASNVFDVLTIGGITSELVVGTNTGTVTRVLQIAHVPEGTSGDIVVSLTGTANRACVYLWRIDGLRHNAAYASSNLSAAPATANYTVPKGGIILGAARSGTSTITLTGIVSDATEDPSDSGDFWNGGHLDCSTTQTQLTVQAERADAGAVQFLSASWVP